MKKMLYSVCFGLLASCFLLPIHAQEFYYGDQKASTYFDQTVDLGKELKDATVSNNESILNKLLRIFELDDGYNGPDKAVRYVKGIVNLILSLASLVALVRIIYGFYAMFFSSEEAGIARARKILKVSIIALVLIGLSRLLTSFFFYIYKMITGGA